MLIKQISVFVENKPGRLLEVTEILGENGIDMSALSLADTTDDIGNKLLPVIRGSVLKDQPYRLFPLGVSDHSSFPSLPLSSVKALIP